MGGGGGGHKISAVLSKYPSLMSLQLHSHMICLLGKKKKKKKDPVIPGTISLLYS